MGVSRMDLADAGSPEKLVKIILELERDLPLPVPLEDLCAQLDIEELRSMTTEGFEGGLITDRDRSSGIILYREAFEGRRRFTIAHELGHFLMPSHVPDREGQFLCSRADMMMLKAREGDRRQAMEVEANRFAGLLLMPPPMVRTRMGRLGEPDLEHIPKLARDFGVSKEAMARTYVQNHDEMIAVVFVKDGKIRLSYKSLGFPFITLQCNSDVPAGSTFFRGRHQLNVASLMEDCPAELWIDVDRRRRTPAMREQVYLQRDGFAMMLLWLESRDEDEDREDDEIEQSWRVGFPKRR